jgi:HEPN domain-containing protein
MLPTTQEWVSKAEGDYVVVSVLLRSRKRSRYDAITFHCQQCVEKYVKARLIEAGIAFPKIHDLPQLLKRSLPVEPLWSVFAPEFKLLTEFAILPRYPGVISSQGDAKFAVATCRRFRKVARESLGV